MTDVDHTAWSEAVGPVWTREELAKRLEVSPWKVASAVAQRRLLELLTTDGRRLYPTWQIRAGAVVPGLAELLTVLAPPVVDNWTLASCCRAAQAELAGRSVADVLAGEDAAAGGDQRVLRLARRAAGRWKR